MIYIRFMRHTHLHSIDLNLLKALSALLARRHITAAAADVGLSQPAMSRALQRLRVLFDDPLLVRASGGLVLTPKGQSLAPRVRSLMTDIAGMMNEPSFEPETARRTVRLIASDYHMVTILPALMKTLRRKAPGLTVMVEPYSTEAPSRIARGEIDIIFATEDTPLSRGASAESLFEDHIVTAVRDGHPVLSTAMTVHDFANLAHVSVSLLGDGRSDIDSFLAARGLTRTVALTTTNFIGALAVVGATDMALTASARLVRTFGATFGLTLVDPPIPKRAFVVTQVWSAHFADDPFHVWLRGQIRDAVADRPRAIRPEVTPPERPS